MKTIRLALTAVILMGVFEAMWGIAFHSLAAFLTGCALLGAFALFCVIVEKSGKPASCAGNADTGVLLSCGHDQSNWYSICSAHQRLDENCPRCNVGRCILCVPEIPIGNPFLTFDRKSGERVNAFPNLGVRRK